MKKQHLALVVCLPLSLVGVCLSVALLRMHAEGANYTGLLSAACGGEKKGCDKVIHSGWGWFPPTFEESEAPSAVGPPPPTSAGPPAPTSAGPPAPTKEPTDSKEGRIPVAALGFFYFATLAVWFSTVGVPSWNRRRLYLAVVGLCVVGAVGSAWFIVVMAAFVKAWCPVCLGSHVVNFLILGTVLFCGPKREASGSSKSGEAHPSTRLTVVTATLAIAVCVAGWNGYTSLSANNELTEIADSLQGALDLGGEPPPDNLESKYEEASAQLEEFKQNVEQLDLVFLNQKKTNFKVNEDTDKLLKREKKGPGMTLTYFSDLECPHCASFDEFLFKEIKPLYEGHLRIVFKHYPLESLHKNAYTAAAAAEAAHVQGKFWEAHDYLIKRRNELATINYKEMAAALDLDAGRFIADINSEEVRKRVDDDAEFASRRLRLTSTPAVYLNGRPVSKLFRKQIGFWNMRVKALKGVYKARKRQW